MSLADDVVQQAGPVQSAPGQTVGNAVEAYQLQQKTQEMRADLDKKKQENETNKSHWLLGQIDTIGRMPEGAARDLAITAFGKQAPSVFPNFNPDIPTLFKKDPELVMKANTAAQAYMNGQAFDPTALNAFASANTPDALKMINTAAENVEKIKAASLMAGNKQENKDNSDFEKLGEKVNNPSSRSTIGRYQQNLDKVETLKKFDTTIGVPNGEHPPEHETTEQKIERYNKASPQDLFEVVKAADQLISNAQSTVYGADHLMPNDMGLAQAKFGQWISNGSVPANSGSFIAKFMNMAQREGQYYRTAKTAALKGLTSGYSHLEKKNPDRFHAVVGSALGESTDGSAPSGPAAQTPAAAPAAPAAGNDPLAGFNAWKSQGKPKP